MFQLVELRLLLEEAHNHLWRCPHCACGKSSDGAVSLYWGRYDPEPAVEVRHMCGFDARDMYWDGSLGPFGVIVEASGAHYTTFKTVDAALNEVRRWHHAEMAKDHSTCSEETGSRVPPFAEGHRP